MTASIQLDGHDVYSMRLALGLLGIGTLEAEIDLDPGATPPSGTVLLTCAVEDRAAQSFKVTILPSIEGDDAGREALGRFRIFAVQGRGALREPIDGTDYADIDPRLIVEDLVGGEDSDLSEIQDLSTLPRWSTSAGPGKASLTRLCSRLDLGWRVLPSGAVRVAAETWPAYATTAPLYTAEPDAYGLAELALDAPDLLPGMTIRRPDDRAGDPWRVAEVVYSLADGAFRARIRVQRPAGGQGPSHETWRAAVATALPALRYYVPHFGTVVEQDASTGAVGVRLDGRDPPLLTLAAVPLWLGLPGRRVLVPLGARVLVHFVGGDESTPAVLGHEWAGDFTSEQIGDNAAPLAREGDVSGRLVFDSVLGLFYSPTADGPYQPVASNPNTPTAPPAPTTAGTPIVLAVGTVADGRVRG